jgi:hypothetical protein
MHAGGRPAAGAVAAARIFYGSVTAFLVGTGIDPDRCR